LLGDNPQLAPLVDRFGAEAVWHTGIDVLGYPPSWCRNTSEILKIQDALTKSSTRKDTT